MNETKNATGGRMKISDMVNFARDVMTGYNQALDAFESGLDVALTDQQITEYFDVMRYIDERYYCKNNFLKLNYYETVALRKDCIQTLTDNPVLVASLKDSYERIGVEAIRTMGKDVVVHITKQAVDREFADMRYAISVNAELLRNINLQNYMLQLSQAIRVRIKKNIQVSADYCEQIVNSAKQLPC